MTPHQQDAMGLLGQFVGQTVEVLTSAYTANVNPAAVTSAKGIVNAAALRGLHAKGFVRIEVAYWKGARVTVLRTA